MHDMLRRRLPHIRADDVAPVPAVLLSLGGQAPANVARLDHALAKFGTTSCVEQTPMIFGSSARAAGRSRCPSYMPLQIGGVPLIHPGDDARFMLIGAKEIGGTTLLRFYVLHCVGVPLIAAVLMAVHFWRIRKDGGISGPL